MTYKENITAILECNFAGFDKEIIEGACNRILELSPTLDKITDDIKDWQTDIHDNKNNAKKHDFVFERIYEIIDEYKTESEA